MKFQLRIKFVAISLNDYDELISLEDRLINDLDETHSVDGHDFGEGVFNLFIHTDAPDNLLANLSDLNILDKAERVSVRELGFEDIKTVWSRD